MRPGAGLDVLQGGADVIWEAWAAGLMTDDQAVLAWLLISINQLHWIRVGQILATHLPELTGYTRTRINGS